MVPLGVYRFATFEEADAWMTRMMARTHTSLGSRTSSGSAGRCRRSRSRSYSAGREGAERPPRPEPPEVPAAVRDPAQLNPQSSDAAHVPGARRAVEPDDARDGGV